MKNIIKKILQLMGWKLVRLGSVYYERNSLNDFYKTLDLPQNPILFDIGANSGQTIQLMLEAFHNPKIFSFEPTIDLFEELESKYKNFPNIVLSDVALSNINGETTFYINQLSKLNSIQPMKENSNHSQGTVLESYTVKTAKLDDIITKEKVTNIDLLKIDVQGHEAEVLMGANKLISQRVPQWIIVEILIGDAYQTNSNQLIEIFQILNPHYQLHSILDMTYMGKDNSLSHADFVFKRLA